MIIGYGSRTAKTLREKIDRVIRGLGLGDEAITDIAMGHVTRSCDGRERAMPYLLVCSTDIGEIGDIMKALIRAGIAQDTEWLLLGGFKSADDMKADPEFDSGLDNTV